MVEPGKYNTHIIADLMYIVYTIGISRGHWPQVVLHPTNETVASSTWFSSVSVLSFSQCQFHYQIPLCFCSCPHPHPGTLPLLALSLLGDKMSWIILNLMIVYQTIIRARIFSGFFLNTKTQKREKKKNKKKPLVFFFQEFPPNTS